jgi:hypothetical protein
VLLLVVLKGVGMELMSMRACVLTAHRDVQVIRQYLCLRQLTA